jgi:hypothetical protein
MVEAVAGVIAELVPAIVAGITDVAAMVLVVSIRPWQYIVSPNYRALTRVELGRRGVAARCWYMAWGSIASVSSVVLLGTLALVLTSSHRPDHLSKFQAVRRAEKVVAEHPQHAAAASAAEGAAVWLRR